MTMEEHFQVEHLVEFELDGLKFKYKPVTAGDELSWLSECMVVGTDGKSRQSHELVNKCKFRNLVEAPYTKEIIKKIIGHDKNWAELNHDERWNLVKKMKVSFFDKIVLKMKDIDAGTKEEQEQKKD